MADVIFTVRVDTGKSQREVENLKKSFHGLKDTASKIFSGLGGIAMKGLESAFSAVQKLVGSFKDIGVDAVKNSIALEDAMAGVRKTAGLTAQEVGDLTRKVRDFVVEEMHGMVSAEDLASALEIAGQQGIFAGKSFEQASDDALAFAKVMTMAGDVFGGLSTEKAAEKLGLLHGTFSDFIPDIERAASVINYFGDNTKRSEGFILNLAGQMAESANLMNLTEAATIAVSAALGNINQQAEKSGTAMSRVFDVMRFRTAEFAAAFQLDAETFTRLTREDMTGALEMFAQHLQQLGQSSEGIDIIGQAMQDLQMTGSGVKNTLLGLGTNADKLTQYLREGKEQWDLNESAMNSFIDGSDRVSKLWQALGTIWTNTIGVLSDLLMPVFKTVLKLINEQAAAFRQWALESEFVKTILPRAIADLNRLLSDAIKAAVEFVKTMDWRKLAKDALEFVKNIDMADIWRETKEFAADFFSLAKAALPLIIGLTKTASKLFVKISKTFTNLEGTAKPLFRVLKFGFEGMQAPIKAVNALIGGLTGKIKEVIDGLRKTEEVSHKKSVWPDMAKWVDTTESAVGNLNTKIGGTVQSLSQVGGAIETARQATADWDNDLSTATQAPQIAEGVVRQALSDAGRDQGRGVVDTNQLLTKGEILSQNNFRLRQQRMTNRLMPPPAAQAPPRSEPTSVRATKQMPTIVFQGTNVIDHSSQKKFVRTITKTQTRLGKGVVRGG